LSPLVSLLVLSILSQGPILPIHLLPDPLQYLYTPYPADYTVLIPES